MRLFGLDVQHRLDGRLVLHVTVERDDDREPDAHLLGLLPHGSDVRDADLDLLSRGSGGGRRGGRGGGRRRCGGYGRDLGRGLCCDWGRGLRDGGALRRARRRGDQCDQCRKHPGDALQRGYSWTCASTTSL
ncbi:hypothetical protein FXF51_57670 [Nonomuraea sp. PA05]|nr:hypothetical protein FXF51_57670 [Nonomuraea sp. PA05]